LHRKDISNHHVCLAYIEAERINDARPDKALFTGDPAVFPYDVLMGWFPACPFKIIYRAMERACRAGLIEYGVSLRTGWLTADGLSTAYNEHWRDVIPQVPLDKGRSIPPRL
jgi:hypothetical protein